MNVLKYVGLAAIALSSSIAVAQAEPMTPQALHALIKPGESNAYGKLGGTTSEFSGAGQYYRHCYEADWYDDGTYYYIFAFNLEGDYEYSSVPHAGSGNTVTQTTLNVLCSTGQGYFIYLNSSGGFYYIQEKAY